MIFDQYSRYKACADILLKVGLQENDKVLDIGSGPECLFGGFLPDIEITYVDPLIPAGSGGLKIQGDIFSNNLKEQDFDFVTAVDVLEHVPAESRHSFLSRLSKLGRRGLVLGFTTADSSSAALVDDDVNEKYREVFGCDYPWLEEHIEYGLPSLAETVAQLEGLGWHCKTIGHGYAPWLSELLGFTICVWDVQAMHELVDAISGQFNDRLYPYDFRSPHYREYVVASRYPLADLKMQESVMEENIADETFRELMDYAYKNYFSVSLKALKDAEEREAVLQNTIKNASKWGQGLQAGVEQLDEQVNELTRKTQELSQWGEGLQAALEQRDEQVNELTRKTQELSQWGEGLQVALEVSNKKLVEVEQALELKHAELMNMSDWAYGMMQELKHRSSPLHIRLINLSRVAKQFAHKKLANSLLGDLVRYVKNGRRYRANMVSFEAIAQSLKENDDRLIITFPIITWDFRWQRPQHIVSRLRDYGHSVVYLAMSMTPLNHRVRSIQQAGATLHYNNLAPHVNQIWLNSKGSINIYTDSLEGDDLHNLVSGLSALLDKLKPKSISYLIQFPGWWPLAEALRNRYGGKIIFDCMDDHSGFSTNTKEALETEDSLLKNADLVIVSSDLLEAKAKQINTHVIQIKNGTEFEHFANPCRNGELDHLSDRPIIGYYGAISDWFDMELVAKCARKFPDWSFVLIGATFGADLKPVEGLSNVIFLGEKPYKELPGYLGYFDVCTIPFKVIPLTLATNPVKFYEYLSAGKPVVSVELPELVAYRDDCYLARSAEEFLTLLQVAFNERKDENKIRERINLARDNSWDSRVGFLINSSQIFN